MNISDYDFHDGCIINICQNNGNIEIAMESAEISDEELKDDIVLTISNTIRGKLHVEGVKRILINDILEEKLIQDYDVGTIFSFNITGNHMVLLVGWENCFPKIHSGSGFSKIEVDAKRIYWENIPSMQNPFRKDI